MDAMKTARLISDLSNKFNGEAHLFQVDPPMVTVEYGPDDCKGFHVGRDRARAHKNKYPRK
jgi:hypothetical protein